MSIFILDDQQPHREGLKKLLTDAMLKNNYALEPIYQFNKGKELIELAKKTLELNLFFIDIQLKHDRYGGFEVAKKIREIDTESMIVFISTHSELALVSYQYMISALGFLEKSLEIEKLKEEIVKILEIFYSKKHLNSSTEFFIFKNKSLELKLPLKEILYFSTIYDHKIDVVTFNQLKEFYGSLKELEKINPKFIRIHQSYLINLYNLKGIDKSSKKAVMANNDILPISRKFYKKIVVAFETEKLNLSSN